MTAAAVANNVPKVENLQKQCLELVEKCLSSQQQHTHTNYLSKGGYDDDDDDENDAAQRIEDTDMHTITFADYNDDHDENDNDICRTLHTRHTVSCCSSGY